MMQLMQGDCLELMKNIPDGSIDMVITSPPYDDLREYHGYKFDWHETIKELYRIVKIGGVVVWIVADQTKNGSETGTSFKQALSAIECGFNLHDTMIWNKGCPPHPEINRYYNAFEYMFVFSKGNPNTVNLIKDKKNKYAGDKIHGSLRQKDGSLKYMNKKVINEFGVRLNIWDIPAERKNKTAHPAVFPVQLVKDHIISWSNEGETVLDCFMGSGTTGVACIDTGRDFIGIEIDKQYFDIAKKRIEDAQAKIRI